MVSRATVVLCLAMLAHASVARGASATLSVDAAGAYVELDLVVRNDLLLDAARDAPAIARGDDAIYTGTVRGRPASWVRAARIAGRWSGVFSDGVSLWAIDEADATRLAAHVVDAWDAPRGAVTTTRYLDLKLVLDTEFQALYGVDTASTATAIANVADGLYRAQTTIGITGLVLQPLAANGSLTATDADALLEAFTAYMAGPGAPNPGSAHLLTARELDGQTLGLAFNGTVCTSFATGIDQTTFAIATNGTQLAHELGHGFGANHDSQGNACPASGFVMQAQLSTVAPPPTSFSACSLAYFTQFLLANPTPCLLTPPDPIFGDGYE